MAAHPTNVRSLQAAFYNANGLKTRRNELEVFANQHDLDLILVNETHLQRVDRDPKIQGYVLHRRDRPLGPGGGTAIYIHHRIPHHAAALPIIFRLEAVGVVIQMPQGPLTIFSCYNPPSQLPADELVDLLDSGHSVIAAGDFNAKHRDWFSRSHNRSGRQLRDLAVTHGWLVSAPAEPTHHHYATGLPDILDVVIVKDVPLQIDLTSVNDLSSDHNPVLMHIGDGANDPVNPTRKSTDWPRFNSHCADTLDAVPVLGTIDELERAVETFELQIRRSLDASTRTVPVNPNNHRIPRDILDKIRQKNLARRRANRTRTQADRAEVNRLIHEIRYALADHRNRMFQEHLESLNTEDNSVWKMAKALCSNRKPLPPIHGTRGLVYTDAERVEAFADSLELQCRATLRNVDLDHVEEVEEFVADLPPPNPDIHDPVAPTSSGEIQTLLRNLRARKAPGPDRIPNLALKNLPEEAITALTEIFNAMFRLGHFPSRWKCADVIFIPKIGKDGKFPQNYRPISLLSNVGKLAERLIHARLSEEVTERNLVPEEQFGFRSGHSTSDQLLRVTELSARWLNWNEVVGATFFDVSKAFDTVWHEGLIYKLARGGVSPAMVQILKSFLTDRSFRAKIRGTFSAEHNLEAGVPQGSVLSPLLFATYTADIPKPERTALAIYADDTAILAHSRSPVLLTRYLQEATDELEDYFRQWRIEVNPEKSTALFMARRRLVPQGQVTMEGRPIPWRDDVKYLGVKLDKRLNFHAHVDYALSKGRMIAGHLNPILGRRSKMSIRNKLLIYKTIVRPAITYGSPAWGHATDPHLRKLQRFQNRQLRCIYNAPWYMRNAQLHREADLPTIQEFLQTTNKKAFARAEAHPNALVREAVDYDPAGPHKVRRPRMALP